MAVETVQQDAATVVVVQQARALALHLFQVQVQLLLDARKAHSHSDILLPPDLTESILTPATEAFSQSIEALQSEYQGNKDALKDILRRDLLGFEARRLVLDAAHVSIDGKADDTIDQEWLENAKQLFDRLDIVLGLDLCNLVDANLVFSILEEVLDRLTIEACSTQFSYIESRVIPLTRNLVPSKGKGLALLRICNELVRRLSKPTRNHTIFAGRVLSLLSGVLPLGERSGVNFRGDFNTDNKTIVEPLEHNFSDLVDVEDSADVAASDDGQSEARLSKEERKAAEAKAQRDADLRMLQLCEDARFYSMFWSAQAWFANPIVLFDNKLAGELDEKPVFPKGASDPLPEGSSGAIKQLRTTLRCILDVFAAVARREKEKSGKASLQGKKRSAFGVASEMSVAGAELDAVIKKQKRDKDGQAENDNGFFPKYLTGRNLFTYELRDASFRRHILVQFLILFQFMLTFTAANREEMDKWKNQALLNALGGKGGTINDFNLDEADERWVNEMWREIINMIQSTPSEGRSYTDSVLLILQREQNWFRWKANECQPIDRASLTETQLQAFVQARKALLRPLRPYPHNVGTAALSRLWDNGVQRPEPQMRTMENAEGIEVQVQTDGLDELEMGPMITPLEQYVSKIERVEQLAAQRRSELGWDAPKPYVIGLNTTAELKSSERERILREEKDKSLTDLEQQRTVLAWRAMRMARGQYTDCVAKMRCDMPDGSTTIGPRVDDVTRLFKAVSDKQNGIPALPTPAPAPPTSVAEDTKEDEKSAEERKDADGMPKEAHEAKKAEENEAREESPEYEPQESSLIKNGEDVEMKSDDGGDSGPANVDAEGIEERSSDVEKEAQDSLAIPSGETADVKME